MGIVDELEWAIDIVDLVQKYSKIKKAGTNYKGLCPFPGHNEKTPSFIVSPAKQIWYCFGCHRGGWPLKFIMDIENCEFREALEILWNLTWKQVNSNFDKEKYQAQKNLYSLYKDATEYYKQALSRHPEIKKYLMDRWFNSESFETFHFGYADSWVELFNYLKWKWYDDKMIEDSKIFLDIRTKKDKFIWRVVFPIQNARWDFVAFTGRVLDKWEPKYLNSPASDIYDKSGILYGMYSARHAITKMDYVIVTEWNPDTIALQQYWFKNSVAVSGTALTDKHLSIIKRLTKKIYLCFDNDNAGHKATKLSLETMKNKDLEVKIIQLKWWKDPDEILKSWGNFQEFIEQAVSPIWYVISTADVNNNSIEEKKKLLKELIELVKTYSDNIEKDFYLKEISLLLDINMKIIYDIFNKTRIKHSSNEEDYKSKNVTSSEDIVIWYILNNPENLEKIKSELIFPEGLGIDLKKLLTEWVKFLENMELAQKERYKWIALQIELESKEKTEDNREQEVEKYIVWLNRDNYKQLSKKLKEEMNMWNNEALLQYSELIKTAKKHWIK